MEKWKDIKGYEGLYQISDEGRVKSLDRYIILSHSTLYRGKVLKQSIKNDYYTCVLSKDNKQKTVYVHRIEWIAFNSDTDKQIDHINNIKTDNNLSNLQELSIRDNTIKARKLKKHLTSSKYIGVTAKGGKWIAEIMKDRVRYRIGSFDTEYAAHLAYTKKEQELNGN